MGIERKKFERIIYVSALAIALFVVIVFFIVKQENRKLFNEGIRVEARILNKNTQGNYSRKGRSKKRYYLTLAFFADTAQAKVEIVRPKSENINDKMDALFENVTAQRIMGEYTSGTLTVSNETYQRLKIGDVVTVVHLRGKPETARLLSEVD